MEDRIPAHIQQLNASAIGELYEAYGPALFNVALRIVHSQQLAEQVLQDTFVKVWRNGDRYDATKGRLFTWLLNITRNTAIDATRTTQYRQYAQLEDIENVSQSFRTEALHVDALDLRQVTSRLNVKYQRLIELVYFQGYSQQEAADVVGIPLGTLKTRLRQAILLLRRTFEEPQHMSYRYAEN